MKITKVFNAIFLKKKKKRKSFFLEKKKKKKKFFFKKKKKKMVEKNEKKKKTLKEKRFSMKKVESLKSVLDISFNWPNSVEKKGMVNRFQSQ